MKVIQVSNNRKQLMDLLQDHKDEILIISITENENIIVLSNELLVFFLKDFNITIPEIDFNIAFDEIRKTVIQIKPLLIGRKDFII